MKLRLGGLHLQLLGFIILPLSLALFTIALTGINIHQGAMRQLVAERDERAVRAAAEAISEQLHHRDAAILGLSKRLEDGIPASVIIEQSEFLYPDFDAGLGVFDIGGTLHAATTPDQDWERWPLDSIIPMLSMGQTTFSEPVIKNEATFVIAGARSSDQIILGVFSIDGIMRSTILEAGLGPVGYRAFLTDRDGQVLRIVGEQISGEDLKTHLGVSAALRGEVGSSFIPADDSEHVVAFSPIQPTGWALVLEEPWEAVASPILDLSLAAPLVLVPALLVTLVALWFGARQVIGPIRKLQEQAEAMVKSNYTAIDDPVGGIGEIQGLQETLAWMASNVREAQSALQRYIGAITDAQEDERRRLARELHDETIQDLIAIDQHIQMIHIEPERFPEVEEQLGNLRKEVNDSIKELRRLIRALRPIYLDDLGLVPALEMLANETQRDYGLSVEFNFQGKIQRLDPSAELAIYRIVQEGLSNSVKHAKAKKTEIQLQFLEELLLVDIQDDGVGFTPPERPRNLGAKGHFGLMGIFERAELIGAKLTLDSEEEVGTRILVELPLQGIDVRR